MKLDELLKAIPPLPYKADGEGKTSLISRGAYPKGSPEEKMYVVARCGIYVSARKREKQRAVAEYLCLAANMLPELVEALKEIERDSDCGMSRDVARTLLEKLDNIDKKV